MHSQHDKSKSQAPVYRANPMPFCAIPRALVRDPGLTLADKVIAAAIMPWLKNYPYGFVHNSILVKETGLDRRTIQRSLKRLEATLWFRCQEGRSYIGQRRITALWRTPEGLRAINERQARLDAVEGERHQNRPGAAPEPPKVEGMSQREAEQRFLLEGECMQSAPALIPVVSSSVGEADDSILERMVALAYALPGISDDAAWPLVDEFADLSVLLAWDENGNRSYHCGVARSIQGGELAPVSLEAIARDFVARAEVEPWDRPAAVYTAAIERKRLVPAAS